MFIKLDLLFLVFHRLEKGRCLLRTHLAFLFWLGFGDLRGRSLFRFLFPRAFHFAGRRFPRRAEWTRAGLLAVFAAILAGGTGSGRRSSLLSRRGRRARLLAG